MHPLSSRIRHSRRAALTLIELLVVLSLVAIVSTVALRSVVGTLEQKNYDANIRQLEEIEKAVLGIDGRGGFLRDIGRLPVAVGNDPRTQLQELWIQGDLPDYTVGDPRFRFGGGWRGPYLNLGINRSGLTDGFGNTFEFFQANGDLVLDGDTIAIIRSLGAEGEDLVIVFEANATAVADEFVDKVTELWRPVLIEDQYDTNIEQLEEIKQAVLGVDGRGGFLGDIGRLPQVPLLPVGGVPETQLAELWDQDEVEDAGIQLYAIRQAPGDSEVRLGTGWRGPYLNLGFNRGGLTDGFGNPFWLWKANGDPVLVGDEIAIVQSLGISGTLGGTGYEADLEIVFQVDEDVLPLPNDKPVNNWQRDVTVNVIAHGGQIEGSAGRYVIVRVYGADGSGGIHTIDQKVFDFDDPSNPSQVVDREFTFANLPHGAKVFRAYQLALLAEPDKEDLIVGTPPPPSPPPVSHTASRKSPATHVVIDRFTDTIPLTLY